MEEVEGFDSDVHESRASSVIFEDANANWN
jgi:hypothetical protein